MYAAEGPYTIDVRHIEAMVRMTREAADGDRVRWGRDGDETRDETVGPRDETHGHVMQQIIKILFTNRFSQFCWKKISNKQAINAIKKINKKFNKTIWILTFFS